MSHLTTGQTIGGYHLIGAHKDEGQAPKVLILDTNVLIDIKNFYFHGPPRKYEGLKTLLQTFPMSGPQSVDINYGWAAAEATWRRGGTPDLARRREFVYAASTVVNWSPDEVEKRFAHKRPPIDRDKRWLKQPIADKDEVPDSRIMLAPHYGSILYLMHLFNTRQQEIKQNPINVFRDYYEWTSNHLGIRDSYSTSFALALICGDGEEKNKVNGILKLSGDESGESLAAKCWNVSWDMLMLSLSEGNTYGLADGFRSKPTCLVTRDSDPSSLRGNSELRMMIDSGSDKIPFSMLSYTTNRKIDTAEIEEILRFDIADFLTRYHRDANTLKDQAYAAIFELETQMGITRKFSEEASILSD